jgi:hypothetical protein
LRKPVSSTLPLPIPPSRGLGRVVRGDEAGMVAAAAPLNWWRRLSRSAADGACTLPEGRSGPLLAPSCLAGAGSGLLPTPAFLQICPLMSLSRFLAEGVGSAQSGVCEMPGVPTPLP